MSRTKSILPLALGGLLIGLMLGAIAAGAYAAWVTGGDAANVGFTTIFAFFPASMRAVATTEPIRTALLIWGGLAGLLVIAVPALGTKRDLSSHGTARWATDAEMKKAGLRTQLRTLNGPIYGKLGGPKTKADFLSSREIPHSLVSGPSGSGKTAGVVIPTLLTYPGSIFCLDVKGELFRKTSRRRLAFGDKVFKFAPYDPDNRTHRYNPLQDVADTHPRRRFTEARRLAGAFIIAEAGGKGFLGGARDIFAATAILVIERKTPTIGAILDALSEPGEAFAMLRKLGEEVEAPEAKKIFNKMSGYESRVLSSYLSVLSDGGLNVWADPAVRAATSASDFSIHDMRSEPTSIYIVVSDNDLVPLAPLIRLMFQQTIAIMQRSEPDIEKGEKYTVLFCLDEFASLGEMDQLSSAISTLRSYGGRVMIVIQSIAQLRKHYGQDGAEIFLGNCRIQIFWAPADQGTPEYISTAIGDFTRPSKAKSWKGGELTTSYQEREEGAPLIRPEQVRMIGEGRIVALVQNSCPIIADQVVYYQDKVLKEIYEGQVGPLPNPPVLPDDLLPETLEPIVPALPGGGAENPLAALRPLPDKDTSRVAAPKDETDVAASAETPVATPGKTAGEKVSNIPTPEPETAPVEETEEVVETRQYTRADRLRSKSRHVLSSVDQARDIFGSSIAGHDDQTTADDPKEQEPTIGSKEPTLEGQPPATIPKTWTIDPQVVSDAQSQHLRDTGRAPEP